MRSRAWRSGARSTPPKRSRAWRWAAVASRLWWACWPWRSTRRAPSSARVVAGGQPAVDVGPAAPVGRHHPGEHDLAAVELEATLHDGFGGPRSNEGGVGSPADQQLDGLDQHRLAGAGLTGERGHARPEHQDELADHPEVVDAQLGEHQRSASPNFAFRIRWKRSLAEPHEARHLVGGPAGDGGARREHANRRPSIDSVGRLDHRSPRWPTSSSGSSTSERSNSMCGDDRREQQRTVLRRHDRSSDRHRVGGDSRRRGDDQAVGGVGGEGGAVDVDGKAHGVARSPASRRTASFKRAGRSAAASARDGRASSAPRSRSRRRRSARARR